jgi:tyrosinase
LIRGLRGEAPFDGTQYPPLPWGGHSVPAGDIAFIANWIDDDCPADDHQISFEVEVTATTTREKIEPANVEVEARSFDVFEGSPNEYAYRYGEVKQRMNIDCMPEPEIDKLRKAFRQMYNLY